MPILPSKEIPLGSKDQPFAHCKRWKVNPDWLHELVQLNPAIGLMVTPLEHREVVQAITMTALQQIGPSLISADVCIVVDWDAFHSAEYRGDDVSGPGDLYFVSSSVQFRLEEWETEPTFGHVEQPGAQWKAWVISEEWLTWALRKHRIPNLTNNVASRNEIVLAICDKVARLSGFGSVRVIVDWDFYLHPTSPHKDGRPKLFFMTNVENLDLRQVAPTQATEPHGSANLMEKASESSVVSSQEGGIKHTQIQGVELKNLKNTD